METNQPHIPPQAPPVPVSAPNISHAPIAESPLAMKKKESGIGSAVAIVVIIGLALGGLYYLATNIEELNPTPEVLPTMNDVKSSDDADVQALLTQNSSDDLDSIDADVNQTDLSGVDSAAADLNASIDGN